MTEQPPPSSPSFYWQPKESRLSSGDKILIVTDIYTFREALYPCSAKQAWFRVGAINLKDNSVGFWRFSLDDARALLKCGIAPPPWTEPQNIGLRIKRERHVKGSRGRFKVTVTPVSVDPAILAKATALRKHFQRKGHDPNVLPGIWDDLLPRVAAEISIQEAALAMVGIFKAADVRRVVGDHINVSPVLRRLVREGRLTPVGKKKYIVSAPAIIDRSDWTG